jgi:hypothetical protein
VVGPLSLAALVGTCAAAPSSAPYVPCAGWAGTTTFTALMLDPAPPSLKKVYTEYWTFSNARPIVAGAKVSERVSVGGTTLSSVIYDLCEIGRLDGRPCPMAAGERVLRWTQRPLAAAPPFVALTVHREAVNGDGSRLFCMDIALKFVP